VAGEKSRRLLRHMAADLQKGFWRKISFLSASVGRGAMLRVDRWTQAAIRQEILDSAIHATTTEKSWSKINTGHVERLTKLGKMKEAGRLAIEAAKNDGRWDAAYHSPGGATIPEDFLAALARNKKARAFFLGR